MEHHLQDLTQLAIIGNGFDLAHGYHTRYVDFTESVGDDFFRKYRHYINNYCPQMDWHRFEECADQLTVPLMRKTSVVIPPQMKSSNHSTKIFKR